MDVDMHSSRGGRGMNRQCTEQGAFLRCVRAFTRLDQVGSIHMMTSGLEGDVIVTEYLGPEICRCIAVDVPRGPTSR